MNGFVPYLVALGVVALFLTPLLAGIWVLRPIDRAARASGRRVQFTIADLLSLFVLIQLPLSFVIGLIPMERREPVPYIAVVLAVIATAIWWTGVSGISRMGVQNSWLRIAFLCGVLPVCYYGFFGLVAAAIGLIVGIEESRSDLAFLATVALAVGWSLLIAAGLFTRWLVRHTPPEGNEPPPPPE
jgi:hypothetical protein